MVALGVCLDNALGFRSALGLAACIASLLGCSSSDRPPVFEAPIPDGGAGTSVQTEAGDSDTDADVDADSDGGIVGGSGGNTSTGTSGTFDPNTAYVYAPGMSNSRHFAIAPASNPQAALFGIDNGFCNLELLNQGVIYEEPSGSPVYRFVPEYSGLEPQRSVDTKLNDTKLDITPCKATDLTGPYKFLTSPTGRFIYECEHAGPWYEAGTQVYSGTAELTGLGNGDLAFFGGGVVNLTDEEPHLASPTLPLGLITAHRAGTTGFDIALILMDTTDIQLFHIDAQGKTTSLGQYPDLPTGVSWSSSVLLPDHSLMQLSTQDGMLGVNQRPLKGDSTMIYMESGTPYVTLGGAVLLTGP